REFGGRGRAGRQVDDDRGAAAEVAVDRVLGRVVPRSVDAGERERLAGAELQDGVAPGAGRVAGPARRVAGGDEDVAAAVDGRATRAPDAPVGNNRGGVDARIGADDGRRLAVRGAVRDPGGHGRHPAGVAGAVTGPDDVQRAAVHAEV